MLGIWSFLRQFMYTKFIVITDEDVDVRWEDVIWAMTTRMDPRRDSVFIDNTPIDYLDFASPAGLGSKVGMDATNKREGETDREWGTSIQMTQRSKSAWTRFGILWASTCQGANAKTFDPNCSQGCHHRGCWLFSICSIKIFSASPQAVDALSQSPIHWPHRWHSIAREPVKALTIDGASSRLICARACVAEGPATL